MRWVAAALFVALVARSAELTRVVAQGVLEDPPSGKWSTDLVVWYGELALAACSGVLAVAATAFIVRCFRAGSAGSAGTIRVVGLGFLAVGALGSAAGWLGLQVPTTPGHDFLLRGEPVFIIAGVIAGAFGMALMFASSLAISLGDPRR
jgi:hypothetical protein